MPTSPHSPRITKAPKDWVDWVVVQRLVVDLPPGPRWPSRAERLAAVQQLLSHGGTTTGIAARLRVSGVTARELVTTVMERLAAAQMDALRTEVGPVDVGLAIGVRWLDGPVSWSGCDCGYLHAAPATCELSYWVPDPVNPRDGSVHQEVLARQCLVERIRAAAEETDGPVQVELGLQLARVAGHASRVDQAQLMYAAAA